MAQTATGPRKREFVGIPFDRKSKLRLLAVAKEKATTHTELARDYVMEGVERDEKQLASK